MEVEKSDAQVLVLAMIELSFDLFLNSIRMLCNSNFFWLFYSYDSGGSSWWTRGGFLFCSFDFEPGRWHRILATLPGQIEFLEFIDQFQFYITTFRHFYMFHIKILDRDKRFIDIAIQAVTT